MKIFELFPTSYVAPLGWTLLHSVWQVALLSTLAALGFYFLRRSTAPLRYTVGVAALGTQILASVTTYLYYLSSAIEAAPASVLARYTPTATFMNVESTTVSLPTFIKMQLWLGTHLSELVFCWGIGVLILLLRFAGGWVYLERLRFASQPVKDAVWTTRFGVLVAKMNIGRSVELRETARIVTPMIVGVLQPVVLVPMGLLLSLSVAQVEAILAHELAHIRRHDYLVNLIQSFVEVVFFFHPALWWLSNRIREEREHCCDDLAMGVCDDRMSLAHALVRVAEFRSEPALVVAFAATKPLLLQRVRRVLGVVDPSTRGWSGYVPVALVLLSLLAGASVYAFQSEKTKAVSERSVQKLNHDNDYSQVLPAVVEEENSILSFTDFDTLIHEPAVEAQELLELALAQTVGIGSIQNDSTRKKMEEARARMEELQKQMQPYHKEMEALHKQMEPLHQRMTDLHLRMEKEQFEVERVQREEEKIEWKKEKLMEARQQLMEKRARVLRPKSNQPKAGATEVEKQLAEVETQIKEKEEEIKALNADIIQTRKQEREVEQPLNTLNAEMEKINREAEVFEREMEKIGEKMEVVGQKMEEVSKNMGLEAMNFIEYAPAPPAPPRPARAPKAAPSVNHVPPAAPAAPKPAPRPPLPPKKK